MALNRELMNELIEALESGKYQKGKGCLRTEGNAYCCLGVLCDLASQKGFGQWTDSLEWMAVPEINGYTFMDITNEEDAGYLTTNLRRQVGMDTTFMHRLVEINDSNDTFKPIIKAIKNKLEEESRG